jgi:folate-binding protein YgfZ
MSFPLPAPWTPATDGEFLAASSLAAELELADAALSARCGVLAALTDRRVLRASGPDAFDYLQNLLTNDVKTLTPGESRLAGFCTPKGRLLALFSVLRDPWQPDDLLLVLPADLADALHKRLSMYILRSKVKLTDASGEFALFGLAGVAADALPALPSGVAAVPLNRLTAPCLHLLLVRGGDLADAALPALAVQFAPIGAAAWRAIEIGSGFPIVRAATQEAFVPQMLNLELQAVGGVNFRKGCYPGQEIVARTQYLGKIKRRTYHARIAAGGAVPGTPVFAPETGDQPCGSIVNAAPARDGGQTVLVCVQSGAVEGGAIHLGASDGPRLELLTLPYDLDGPDTRAD